MHVTLPGPAAEVVMEHGCAPAGQATVWVRAGCSRCPAFLLLAGELMGAALGCGEGQGQGTTRSESLSWLPFSVCACPLLEDVCSIFQAFIRSLDEIRAKINYFHKG